MKYETLHNVQIPKIGFGSAAFSLIVSSVISSEVIIANCKRAGEVKTATIGA